MCDGSSWKVLCKNVLLCWKVPCGDRFCVNHGSVKRKVLRIRFCVQVGSTAGRICASDGSLCWKVLCAARATAFRTTLTTERLLSFGADNRFQVICCMVNIFLHSQSCNRASRQLGWIYSVGALEVGCGVLYRGFATTFMNDSCGELRLGGREGRREGRGREGGRGRSCIDQASSHTTRRGRTDGGGSS